MKSTTNEKHPGCWRRTAATALSLTAALASIITVQAEDPPSRVDALVNFEFSDKYLTPRGMIVHEKGLTFQQLTLGFFNLYRGDSFINDVTLVGGVWNDFSSSGVAIHAPFGSQPQTHWAEIDPIAGISLGIAKKFTLSVTYTAFDMQILDIGTSQHLETKLVFDDTDYLKAFALHPYVLYWQELVGKATAADVPYMVFKGQSGPGPSHYFELGLAPSYTFKDFGLKLEAPIRLLFPATDFYGEYYGKSSTLGLFELGLKGTIPLNFMPKGYGHWSAHLGGRYMHLEDDNLASMQEFNAPGHGVRDTGQIYGGIGIFF